MLPKSMQLQILLQKDKSVSNFYRCYQKVCNYKNCCKLKLFSYGCSQPFNVSKPFRFAPRFKNVSKSQFFNMNEKELDYDAWESIKRKKKSQI